jgi:hypothetical protein
MVLEGKTAYVSLAHRYWNPAWTADRNLEVYGDDASPEGIGGNLRLDAFVQNPGTVEHPELPQALSTLKTLVDHKSIFDDFSTFASRASTLEVLTQFLSGKLFSKPLRQGRWHSLRVWQGEKLSCRAFNGTANLELRMRVGDLWLTFSGPIAAETGLVAVREQVFRNVQQTYSNLQKTEFGERADWVFKQLQSQMESLTRIEIDLTRQKYLALHAGT